MDGLVSVISLFEGPQGGELSCRQFGEVTDVDGISEIQVGPSSPVFGPFRTLSRRRQDAVLSIDQTAGNRLAK